MGVDRVKMEEGSPMTNDLDAAEKTRPVPFRSWKKKHQKMRIAFDEKMELNAKLHAQEVLAIQTSKRLAVEIDRILDLLLDINNTTQISGSKRIDLSLPESPKQPPPPSLDIDRKNGWEKRFVDKKHPGAELPEPPAKSLRSLLQSVRHVDLAAAENGLPSLLADLVAGDDNKRAFVVPAGKSKPSTQPRQQRRPNLYPESFLSPDDVDNYLWEVDRTVAGRALLAGAPPPPLLPTLAPFALSFEVPSQTVINSIINGTSTNNSIHGCTINSNGDGALVAASAAGGWEAFFNRSIPKTDLPSVFTTPQSVLTRETILRNPTSVFNWLKNNAPKAVFMQEGEATAQAAAEKENGAHANGSHDDYHHYGQNGSGSASTARGRKSMGAGERTGSGAGGGNGRSAGGGRGGAKRVSAAAAAREQQQLLMAGDDADSDDLSFELTTPRTMGLSAGGRGGKRKRGSAALDDDSSPKTKGTAASTSRGTKRKRKSDGAGAAAGSSTARGATDSAADTPPPTASAAKKARKSGQTAAAKKLAAAAAAAATAAADGEDTEMTEGEDGGRDVEDDGADVTVPVDTEDGADEEDGDTVVAAERDTASVDA